MSLPESDLRVVDLIAARAASQWRFIEPHARGVAVPSVLVAVYRPHQFSISEPAEFYVTASDTRTLLFVASPSQLYSAGIRTNAKLAETPAGTPYYRVSQTDVDESQYGPRSPLRPMLCERDGSGGISEPWAIVTITEVAPVALIGIAAKTDVEET